MKTDALHIKAEPYRELPPNACGHPSDARQSSAYVASNHRLCSPGSLPSERDFGVLWRFNCNLYSQIHSHC